MNNLLGKVRYLCLLLLQWAYNHLAGGRPARRGDGEQFEQACNSFFEKIFVITLPRSRARQEFVKNGLGGLRFEFFFGVDGQEISDAELQRVYSLEKNRKTWLKVLSRNEIAASLSHARLYERIVEQGIRRALILEDDAQIERRWTLPALLENLPHDWDVLRLGFGAEYPLSYLLEPIERVIRLVRPRFRFRAIRTRGAAKYLRTAFTHSGAHGYAVTLDGAKKLLNDIYPISTLPDHFLDICALNGAASSYHSVPRIFRDATNLLGSSIQMTGLSEKQKGAP